MVRSMNLSKVTKPQGQRWRTRATERTNNTAALSSHQRSQVLRLRIQIGDRESVSSLARAGKSPQLCFALRVCACVDAMTDVSSFSVDDLCDLLLESGVPPDVVTAFCGKMYRPRVA